MKERTEMYPQTETYHSLGSLYADVKEGEILRWRSADLRAASFFQTSLKGKTPYALFDKEGADLLMEQYRLAVKSKTERSCTIAYSRGRVSKSIRITIVPLVDDTFNVLQVVCNLFDILPEPAPDGIAAERMPHAPGSNAAHDLMWEWDLRSGSVLLTGKIRELFGEPAIDSQQTLETWQRRIHKEDLDRVREALRRHVTTGEAYNEIYRMQRADGSFFICRDSVSPVFGAGGEVRTLLGTLTDITEQKTREETLQQSIDKYKSLIDVTSDICIECDAQGRIVAVNAKGAQHFGLPAERMRSKWLDDYFYFPDAVAFSDWLARAGQGPQTDCELRTIRSGRLHAVIRCFTMPVWDEAHTAAGFVLVATDISDQRQTLQDYRAIFETSRDGIVLYQGGVIQRMNKAGARQFGVSDPAYFDGRPILDLIHPNQREAAAPFLLPNGSDADLSAVPVFRGLRADGSAFDIEMNISVLRYGEAPTFMLMTRDVTDRRLAHTLLEQSESFFRMLIEHSPDFIALVDGKGKTMYVNPAGKRILGYEQEHYLNRNPLHMIHPADRLRCNRALVALLRDKKPVEVECRLPTLRGEWVEFDVLVVPLAGPGTQIAQYFISARDISARRKAEQAVQRSEQQYQKLFQGATDGLFVYDTAGTITDVNPAGCAMFGYEKKELAGQTIRMLLFPDDPQAALDPYEIISTPQPHIRRLRKKDDAEVWVQWSTSVFEVEGELALLVIKRDVTPEQILRLELEHSHAFNRAVLESFDPIRVIDAEQWTVVSMNAAAERHAVERQDAPTFSCVQAGHPESVCADPECPLHLALRDDKPASVGRYDESRDRWYSVTGYPFSVGDRRYIAEVFRDITRAKKLEQMLSYAQKMETMGSFARNVTQTFDAVLGDILGFTSMAKLKLEKNDQLIRAVESVERSAQQAARMNVELQHLADARPGSSAILRLGELVDDLLPVVSRTFPRSLLIEKDLPPGIWPMIGSREKIEHLILNLCLFFRDQWSAGARADGTATLRIGLRNSRGEKLLEDRAGDNSVCLTIGCAGVPLDPEMFTPASGLFPPPNGHGESAEAIPVLVAIVREHGGHIEVVPAPDGGDMLWIAFPADGGNGAAAPAPREMERKKASGG